MAPLAASIVGNFAAARASTRSATSPSRVRSTPSVRYRKRISAQDARIRLDNMHKKERLRADAVIRTGSISAAAEELGENRRTVAASYNKCRHYLSDLFADEPGATVPYELD